LYNTILDGKEIDLETLMLQLKIENIFLVCSKFLVVKEIMNNFLEKNEVELKL
jgi:hypothetical protein